MQIWIPITNESIGKRQFEKETDIRLIDCTYDSFYLQNSLIKSLTGEIVQLSPPHLHDEIHLGFQTGYALKRKVIGNQAVTFISIGLHSKLLGQDYFKSINTETIYKVWQTIMAQGVINISFDNFLQAHVHQVDLKTDSIQDDVNESLSVIYANIRDINKCKRFNEAKNQGIQIGHRKENEVSIHFYNKSLQFMNDPRSSIFLEKVLRFNHPANILRTEITLYEKHINEDFNMNCNGMFKPNSPNQLKNVLAQVEEYGKEVMKHYLLKALKPQRVNAVKIEQSDNTDGLSERIKFGVDLCLTSAMTLADTEKSIIKLLNPGINKTREVLRLTRHHYTIQTKAIDIDVELKQVMNC